MIINFFLGFVAPLVESGWKQCLLYLSGSQDNFWGAPACSSQVRYASTCKKKLRTMSRQEQIHQKLIFKVIWNSPLYSTGYAHFMTLSATTFEPWRPFRNLICINSTITKSACPSFGGIFLEWEATRGLFIQGGSKIRLPRPFLPCSRQLGASLLGTLRKSWGWKPRF